MTTSIHQKPRIVIRAFNEERWLPEVFEALARQRYRDFEVLLVDSGSWTGRATSRPPTARASCGCGPRTSRSAIR